MTEAKYLTVSQLTAYIKAKFDRDPYMNQVYVMGEISGFRDRGKNNNQYFRIKDEQALISAVMFRSRYQRLNFNLEEGMKVFIKGRIGVYERTGSYQLYVDSIQPDGLGALFIAFEQLKEKLKNEGLFAFTPQAIPRYPKKIAVLTSPSGSVIQDIITTIKRRYPIVQLILYPTVVQGSAAKNSITKNLQCVRQDGPYDTVILARGGGSVEDLWCFNEEQVVRELHACPYPVISSIGHETDTTLCDLVADQRAATPTAAAELATPVLSEEIYRIQTWRQSLYQVQQNRLTYFSAYLRQLRQNYVFQSPQRLFDHYNMRLGNLEREMQGLIQQCLYKQERRQQILLRKLADFNPEVHIVKAQHQLEQKHLQLDATMNNKLHHLKQNLQTHLQQLDAYSPLKRLSQGYTFVSEDEKPISSVHEIGVGDALTLTFHDGEAEVRVEEIQTQDHTSS